MKTNTFNDATMIVTALNRITGLRNLSDSDTRSCTLLNYSYKAFVITLIVFVIYYSNLFMLMTVRFNLKIVVYFMLGFLCFFSFTCITTLSWYHSQGFPMLRQKIADLEDSLTKLGVVVNHCNILVSIIGANILTVLNTIIIIGSYITIIGPQKGILVLLLSQIVSNYMSHLGGLVILDFLTYVWWLKFGFKQTNDLLKKFLVDGHQIKIEELDSEMAEDRSSRALSMQKYVNKWLFKYSTRRTRVVPLNNIPPVKHELQAVKRVQMLQEIRFIHLQLCRITKIVNSVFNMQLMAYTFVIMLYLISILYYLYTKIFDVNPISNKEIHTLAVLIFDPLYASFKIILVSYICDHVAKEAKKVIVIIHECSIYDIDTELKDEVSQFSLQISLSKVGDLKYNLFPLNFSFLRQWIGSMTTYLVIIIQWTQSVIEDNPALKNITDPFM